MPILSYIVSSRLAWATGDPVSKISSHTGGVVSQWWSACLAHTGPRVPFHSMHFHFPHNQVAVYEGLLVLCPEVHTFIPQVSQRLRRSDGSDYLLKATQGFDLGLNPKSG